MVRKDFMPAGGNFNSVTKILIIRETYFFWLDTWHQGLETPRLREYFPSVERHTARKKLRPFLLKNVGHLVRRASESGGMDFPYIQRFYKRKACSDIYNNFGLIFGRFHWFQPF